MHDAFEERWRTGLLGRTACFRSSAIALFDINEWYCNKSRLALMSPSHQFTGFMHRPKKDRQRERLHSVTASHTVSGHSYRSSDLRVTLDGTKSGRTSGRSGATGSTQ